MKRWMLIPMFAIWAALLVWAWGVIGPLYVGFNVVLFAVFFVFGRLSR